MLQFIRFSIFLSITHLFIFSVFSTANAQTPQRDARPRTASVSGRVTISGKAAANAKIVITEIKDKTGAEGRLFSIEELESNAGDDYVALTDAEGRYRATDLPEGKYKARALLGGCVREKSSPATTSDSLVESFSLDEGESRGNVDFALARGGVITGRVTDADGRPLIARSVGLKVVDEEKGLRSDIRAIPGFQNLMATFEMFQTDDRGVYRIYGLPAGRYLVSAGGGSDIELIASARGKYPRVWYPDAADENQAKVIDVAAGAEVAGIDIRLGAAEKTYEASGRVIDDETGKPVAGVSVSCIKTGDSGASIDFGPGAAPRTDEQGNFHFDSLTPGSYQLNLNFAGFASLLNTASSGYYSDGAKFEIQSADVTGVEIRAKRGATISGIAVVEDADQSAKSDLSRTLLLAYSTPQSPPSPNEAAKNAFAMAPVSSRIGNDGGFSFKGVRPGKVLIRDLSTGGDAPDIVRIERSGVEMSDGIIVTGREDITGVRIVFGKRSGVIRGQVNVTGGALLKGWRMSVMARSEKKGANVFGGFRGRVEVDNKGRFVIEGLTPGEYELELMTYPVFNPNSPPPPNQNVPAPVTQKVIVPKGQEAQVTMTLDLSGKNREEK